MSPAEDTRFFLLWVATVGMGGTGRWRCTGDDTAEEGSVDVGLKLSSVGLMCRSDLQAWPLM